jgi:hypothetical protein
MFKFVQLVRNKLKYYLCNTLRSICQSRNVNLATAVVNLIQSLGLAEGYKMSYFTVPLDLIAICQC